MYSHLPFLPVILQVRSFLFVFSFVFFFSFPLFHYNPCYLLLVLFCSFVALFILFSSLSFLTFPSVPSPRFRSFVSLSFFFLHSFISSLCSLVAFHCVLFRPLFSDLRLFVPLLVRSFQFLFVRSSSCSFVPFSSFRSPRLCTNFITLHFLFSFFLLLRLFITHYFRCKFIYLFCCCFTRSQDIQFILYPNTNFVNIYSYT